MNIPEISDMTWAAACWTFAVVFFLIGWAKLHAQDKADDTDDWTDLVPEPMADQFRALDLHPDDVVTAGCADHGYTWTTTLRSACTSNACPHCDQRRAADRPVDSYTLELEALDRAATSPDDAA